MQVSSIVKKILPPLTVVSCASAAASGLWLISLGFWAVLWMPVVAFAFSFFLFPFLMFPAAFFGGMMQVLEQQSKQGAARVMMALSVGWLLFVMALYVAFIMNGVGELMRIDQTRIPAVIWGMSAGMAAWTAFAMRDRDNIFFTGLVLMLAAAVAFTAWRLTSVDLWYWQIVWSVFAPCAVMAAVQALVEKKLQKKTQA